MARYASARWAAVAVALVAGCRNDRAGQSRAKAGPSCNIILITVESLRAGHVTCYGYERDTTPAIDTLSQQAILFENAYAVSSWTLTSHASIFTGLYPTAHQVITPRSRLHRSYTTLAEHLQAGGYQTAGFVSGPFLRKLYNLNQGFEIYDDSVANPSGNQAAHADVTNPRIEALITKFLTGQRDKNRPFFLFAYLWDPHYDYIPPDPYDKTFVPAGAKKIDCTEYETRGIVNKNIAREELAYVISQYDGEILWTDALLGRLWKLLRDLDLWNDTAIIVTSDHGEEFFEHGTKGHKNNLYVESIHVPLVIKPPYDTAAQRDRRIVNLVDLFPTVLELADIEAPPPCHGHLLLQPPPKEVGPVFFELETSFYNTDAVTGRTRKKSDLWYAVRQGNYKLVGIRNQFIWELYNVADDPGETNPLRDEGHRTTRNELRKKIEGHITAMKKLAEGWGKAEPTQLTPEELQRLEALGYIKRNRPAK